MYQSKAELSCVHSEELNTFAIQTTSLYSTKKVIQNPPIILGAMFGRILVLRLKFTSTRLTYNAKDETDVLNWLIFRKSFLLPWKVFFPRSLFYVGYFLAFSRGLSSCSDVIQPHINHFTKLVNSRCLKLTTNLIRIRFNWLLCKTSLFVNLTVKVSSVLSWNSSRWRRQKD